MKTRSLVATAAMAALTIATPAFAKSAPASSTFDFSTTEPSSVGSYATLRAQDDQPQNGLSVQTGVTPNYGNSTGIFAYTNTPSDNFYGRVLGFVGFYTRTADMTAAPVFKQSVEDFLIFDSADGKSFVFDVDSVATDLSDFEAGDIDLTLSGGLNDAAASFLPPSAMPATLMLHLTENTDGTWAMAGTLDVPTTTAAVPEPASWAMMLGGFGLVGGALRSRRRNTAITFA